MGGGGAGYAVYYMPSLNSLPLLWPLHAQACNLKCNNFKLGTLDAAKNIPLSLPNMRCDIPFQLTQKARLQLTEPFLMGCQMGFNLNFD